MSRSVRTGVAAAVWLLAVLVALVLALGALVVALELDPGNGAVSLLTDAADRLDLFGDLVSFDGGGSEEAQRAALVKTLLVSWSLAALAYLVAGKVLERLIRP